MDKVIKEIIIIIERSLVVLTSLKILKQKEVKNITDMMHNYINVNKMEQDTIERTKLMDKMLA